MRNIICVETTSDKRSQAVNEKKSIFVANQLVADLIASLIFAFSVLTVVRMVVLYERTIDLSYIQLLSVFLLTELFVFVRRLRIKLVPMLLLHALPVAGYLFVMSVLLAKGGRKNISECLFFLALMATLNLVYSMFWRFRITSLSSDTYDVFVASMALHLVLTLISKGTLRQSVMQNAFLVVCVFLVARQLYTFDAKYSHNIHSGTTAVKQAKRQNCMTIFLIAGGLILALLILKTVPSGKIGGTILTAIRSFVVMIGSFFSRFLSEEKVSHTNGKFKLPEQSEDTSGEEPILVQILFTIVSVVIVLAILVVVFKAFLALLRKFHWEKTSVKKQDTNGAVVDIIEKIHTDKKPVFTKKDFGEGYERKIRKKYYKIVQKAIRSGIRIDPSYTTAQIKAALNKSGDPSFAELTFLYESVRYGKKNE